MVAAAKLRRAQESMFNVRPYAFRIHEFFAQIQGRVEPTAHPLLAPRQEAENVLLVVITGDRGLAGSFNINAIKKAEETIRKEYSAHHDEGRLFLMCLGRKGHEHFARRNYQLVGDYRGLFTKMEVKDSLAIVDRVVKGYEAREWDRVVVVYNEFKNSISQNLIAEPFLPIPEEEFLTPIMKQDHDHPIEYKEGVEVDFIFEPDAQTLMNVLVPRYLNLQMWRMLLESNASEQGARMVAMDSATSNAGELIRTLTLKYNQVRQAAITTEIIEVSSGAEALKQG